MLNNVFNYLDGVHCTFNHFIVCHRNHFMFQLPYLISYQDPSTVFCECVKMSLIACSIPFEI